MIETDLADGHVWLRLIGPHYTDPFDTSFAQARGGRWNPPDSWPTLYLNEDMSTVHAQLRHMFVGRGIDLDDIDGAAPVELAAATLPNAQRVADVVTAQGVVDAGLPATYPLDADGGLVDHGTTQPIGAIVKASGLDGVWCRSAAGEGNELAWFPAPDTVAVPYWPSPQPYAAWRDAWSVADVDTNPDDS